MHDSPYESSNYDASLEWPGSDLHAELEVQNEIQKPDSHHQTCFRLVVKSSGVLARKRKVAVLDAYDEAQIGRDASVSYDVPRIRLKDMEVSKLHATLFWDRERKEWAIVDMGSKHGTFVKTGSGRDIPADESGPQSFDVNANDAFARLSPPRQASMPRTLRHADEISIGTTVFVVHVHSANVPCDGCRSEGESDIPLFSVAISGRARQQPVEVPKEIPKAPRDVKTTMNRLKRNFLSRHSDADVSKTIHGASRSYVDRSAKRRALHPYSRSSSPPPGMPSRHSLHYSPAVANASRADTLEAGFASSSGVGFDYSTTVSSAASVPPSPISDANVGHRLLAKQGWVPGSTLGVPAPYSPSEFDLEGPESLDERMALSEPLQLASNVGRRGLGMRAESSNHSNGTASISEWRTDARNRRWDDVRRSIV